MQSFYDYCVYVHIDKNFDIRFVGYGRPHEILNREWRGAKWNKIFQHSPIMADILDKNLSLLEAMDLTLERIQLLKKDGYKLIN